MRAEIEDMRRNGDKVVVSDEYKYIRVHTVGPPKLDFAGVRELIAVLQKIEERMEARG